MIDLTLKEEDKDTFITKIYFKDNDDKYIVKYASGREKEYKFSIESFNYSLMKMEEQYLKYKNDFVKFESRQAIKITISKLIEAFLAIIGIYFSAKINIDKLIKTLLILIITIITIFFQKDKSQERKKIEQNLNVVLSAQYFLENKEKFKINIINPETNQLEDWYLLTLSSIEEMYNPNLVNLFANEITDEMKEEESSKISEILKLKMSKGK